MRKLFLRVPAVIALVAGAVLSTVSTAPSAAASTYRPTVTRIATATVNGNTAVTATVTIGGRPAGGVPVTITWTPGSAIVGRAISTTNARGQLTVTWAGPYQTTRYTATVATNPRLNLKGSYATTVIRGNCPENPARPSYCNPNSPTGIYPHPYPLPVNLDCTTTGKRNFAYDMFLYMSPRSRYYLPGWHGTTPLLYSVTINGQWVYVDDLLYDVCGLIS